MFYEELYGELGKLFYYLAAVDGKVHPSEKESLIKLIHQNWEPIESSKDKFGSNQADIIDFSFEYEEEEGFEENEWESFESFYHANRSKFTPGLISNILKTSEAIAASYRKTNKKEQEVLDRMIKLFKS
ncbi:hypothetical protein [Solitalea koreensis]|uniref:Tellurite resistance protein TerB n=1 Tax=Solitalea koreensis TaxID=543615 RepID=A0A521D2Q4_9SPHI|nr:hypothetical protein [Solitalea koreensis]SMO65968.1 hypothetical protein SAMN06265350_105208 [Solitalea koreensis]